MLKVTGTQAFMAKLRQSKVDLDRRVTKTYRNLVKAIITDLVTNSPQWSGNLARNWYVEFGGNKGSYSQVSNYGIASFKLAIPFSRGDDPAVSSTLQREYAKIDQIHWRHKVTFTNYAPYAEQVEQGIGPNGRPIREVNKLAAYGAVAMVGYIDTKYSKLRYLKKVVA